MEPPSTTLRYWLRWEVAMCCLSVLTCLGFSAYLLWRYRGPSRHEPEADAGEAGKERRGGVVYDEELWRPYLHTLHPGWLLAYRAAAFLTFCVLTAIIISSRGYTMLSFYTEWTFLLVTINFGLATALSIHGCIKFTADSMGIDGEDQVNKVAGFFGYLLQIIYQTTAGSVMLTDTVYWCILFPVLVHKPHGVDLLSVVMHSLNAILLLGDTVLNSLHFPWFRMAYFLIWTSLYVLSQWIVHASVIMDWPYPFLDLSSRLAPLWYIVVGVLQIPCYLIFVLLVKLKRSTYSKWFLQSSS